MSTGRPVRFKGVYFLVRSTDCALRIVLGEIKKNIYYPSPPYPNAEYVVRQPSPLVYYVLHAHVDRGQYSAQLSDPAGSVAQRCVELD